MVLSSKEPSLSLTGTILALVSASAIFLREKTLQSWVLRLVCVSLRCLSRMSMPYDSTNHKGFLVEIWSYFWYASIHPTAKAVGTLEERHRRCARTRRCGRRRISDCRASGCCQRLRSPSAAGTGTLWCRDTLCP